MKGSLCKIKNYSEPIRKILRQSDCIHIFDGCFNAINQKLHGMVQIHSKSLLHSHNCSLTSDPTTTLIILQLGSEKSLNTWFQLWIAQNWILHIIFFLHFGHFPTSHLTQVMSRSVYPFGQDTMHLEGCLPSSPSTSLYVWQLRLSMHCWRVKQRRSWNCWIRKIKCFLFLIAHLLCNANFINRLVSTHCNVGHRPLSKILWSMGYNTNTIKTK